MQPSESVPSAETFVHDAVSAALRAFGLAASLALSTPPAGAGRRVLRVKLLPAPGTSLSPRRWGQAAGALQALAEAALVARGEPGLSVELSVPEQSGLQAGHDPEPDDALARAVRVVARRAAALGRPFALGPMSAVERRLVHQALSDLAEVHTQSEGEGIYRRLWVMPRRPAPQPPAPPAPVETAPN